MRVRFLGTGDPVASGGRMQSCVAVEDGTGTFLLDCGATALAAMARFGVDPLATDAVFVSHLHGDHVGGLPFLLFARWLAARRGVAVPPLAIAGPTATEERVAALVELFAYGPFADLRASAPVEFVALAHGVETWVGARRVTAWPVVHFAETQPTALRLVTGGRSIAYSGDTGWTEALVEVADGADLFVCMCHAYAGAWPSHMTFETVMAQRERLRCRRIALTHLGPEMVANLAAARERIAGDPSVAIAEDGAELVL